MAATLLANDHDVIEAAPPDRSDQPLRESILPGRSSRNRRSRMPIAVRGRMKAAPYAPPRSRMIARRASVN
jgi:hypothetical protein